MTMKRRVYFHNDFHNTSAFALLAAFPGRVAHGTLSQSQVRRLRRKLCGVKSCTCYDSPAGTRGSQTEDARQALLNINEHGSWY